MIKINTICPYTGTILCACVLELKKNFFSIQSSWVKMDFNVLFIVQRILFDIYILINEIQSNKLY